MIDIGLCADVVSKTYMNNIVPMGAIIGLLFVLSAVLFFFFIYQSQDVKLMKNFLQREKLLQKYADWLRDQKLE